MELSSIVGILVRWTHISCAVILIGGAIMAAMLARQGKLKGPAWSPMQVIPLLIAIFAAGLYNLMTKMSGAPPGYHAIFGIKFLLVMHIGAVLLLTAKPAMDDAKRARLLTGTSISGLVVILLSATLRSL